MNAYVCPLGLSEDEQFKRALYVSAIEAGSVSNVSPVLMYRPD